MKNGVATRLEIEKRKRENQDHSRDVIKHYVRVKGWVECAKRRLESIREKKTDGYVRYFTLCGENAMDVFLFEKHNLVYFDGRGFPDVVFCEKDLEIFESIRRILKRGGGDFLGEFEEVVFRPEFAKLFPFDIFNLDFTRNCFPNHEQPFSKTMSSIVKIIEEQGKKDSDFDLFVTFRAERSRENQTAIAQLRENMEKNLGEVAAIKEEFVQKYGDKGLDRLLNKDYGRFLFVTFPKLIVRFGNNSHFTVSCSHEYQYSRRYTHSTTGHKCHYKIIKFIFSFKYVHVAGSIVQEVPRRPQILGSNYIEETKHSIKMEPVDVCLELDRSPCLKAKYEKEIEELIRKIKAEEF